MKKVVKAFLLPGVGCDARIFNRLNLPWPTSIVKWPKPYHQESIREYALRVAEQITDPANTVIIGMSFGGMVAAELSVLNPAATVIISSIKSSDERPAHMKLMRLMRLNRLVPSKFAAKFDFWMGFVVGLFNRHDRRVIESMIKTMDAQFNDWAIDAAISWDFSRPKGRVLHIHGTNDRMFPIKKIHDCVAIKNGTHFMVYKKGHEVGRIICSKLKNLC